jgi:hypothetical protein
MSTLIRHLAICFYQFDRGQDLAAGSLEFERSTFGPNALLRLGHQQASLSGADSAIHE